MSGAVADVRYPAPGTDSLGGDAVEDSLNEAVGALPVAS